jgi:hypothetical protein
LSYQFIKVAVAEIPPVTLIAARVSGAAAMLLAVISVTDLSHMRPHMQPRVIPSSSCRTHGRPNL